MNSVGVHDMVNYRKITLQGGRKIQVRKKDFAAVESSMDKHDPHEIALNTIKMAMNSPEMRDELTMATRVIQFVIRQDNIKTLQSLKKMCDYRIKQIRGKKK